MIGLLAAFGPLSERMEAIRNHFTAGGRWVEVAVVLLTLAGCLFVLAVIHRVRDAAGRREPDKPVRMFRVLLSDLGFTPRQRRILRAMAADLKLEHPTVMLLSPRLFAEQAIAWGKMRGGAPTDELKTIARQVFQSLIAEKRAS